MMIKRWIAVGCVLVATAFAAENGSIPVTYVGEKDAAVSAVESGGAADRAAAEEQEAYERITPHRVVREERSDGGVAEGTAAVSDSLRNVSIERVRPHAVKLSPRKKAGKKVPVFRRYLLLIKKRLRLTRQQRLEVRRIVQEKKRKWQAIRTRFAAAMRKAVRIPEAESFMTPKRFDMQGFKMAMVSRQARIKYLKAEKRRRYIGWMAETMKEIFAVLTPQQRRELIRLTSHRKERPRNRP